MNGGEDDALLPGGTGSTGVDDFGGGVEPADDPLLGGNPPPPAPTGGGGPSGGGGSALGAIAGGMMAGYSPGDLFELIKIRASEPAAKALKINHLAQLQAQREFNQ